MNKKKKIQENIKQNTAEDRAKKELDKIAAYQARLAKKSNKQKKIRTVMDENYSVTKQSKAFIYYIISKKLLRFMLSVGYLS